ncbi:MAG: SdrD B-like domain-containing protein [Bacteroidota bacterium]
MRTSLLHVMLLIGAFCTFAYAHPAEFIFSESPDWCYSKVKFKNTGCEKVKIYKKHGSNLYLYKTLSAGNSYSQNTYFGHDWVFKVNGNYLGSYEITNCNNHTYEIQTGGCGSSDCDNVPNYLSGLVYMGEYNGSKYFCSDDNNNNWNEATAGNAATQLGGYLVTINNAGENEFVRNNIMADRVWIGFTDKNSEGNFKWVNNESVTYSNWSYGEPNNQGVSGGQGDYTVLEKSSGKWKDRHGGDHYEFVIEVPCEPTPVCTGEITGLKIYNLDNGNTIDLTDGASFHSNELPDDFNIEAMISGNAESVRFFLSGAINDTHNENVTPYRFNGDNNALPLIVGNYSLTVKAYSQNNGGGEVCDEKTIHFTIKEDPVCTGGITGLKIFNLDGGNNIDLVDGASYELNQLPDNFNIEAMISGNAESVRFYLSGDINDTHTENVVPYRFNGDNNPLALSLGNYSLTVKAFSENHGQGEVCDEKTIHFSITNEPPTCEATCKREVFSIESCSGKGPYTIYLHNANGGNYFDGSGQTWEECEDGTIHYFGTATKSQGSTDDNFVTFDLYFSGKTFTAPAGSPKENACFGFDASTFVYYTQTFGTITSPNHGTIQVARRGPAFQLGIGANHQTPAFGASGWFEFFGGSDYYDVGDVNVRLSPDCGGICENIVMGGTIGFLGSCSPNIVYCKEDGEAPLIQDCISPIGGSGQLEVVWLKSTTSCLPPTTTFANIENDPNWVVIDGANSLDYQPGILSESTCFLRCSRRENCETFIESNIVRIVVDCDLNVDCSLLDISTDVGKIIVSGLDQAPLASVQVFSPDFSTTFFTCPGDCDIPTQVIDLADGDYVVAVKLYDAGFNLICEVIDTYTVPPCLNVGLGGFIGFEDCLADFLYCPLDGPAPPIANCGTPEGGEGDLEIVWLRSTTSCLPPTTTFENIENDPHWEVIQGANELGLSIGDVQQNTCYLRCARRAGCTTFVESNIISLNINTDCIEFDRFGVSIGDRVWDDLNGNGVQDDGEPGLENVWINLQDGSGNSIYWTNTDENGEYVFFGLTAGTYQLQFSTPAGYEVTVQNSTTDSENDSDVDPVFSTSPVLNLLEGDHPRDIDAGFRVSGQFLATNSPEFQFEVVKGEEHTELFWVHNKGETVVDYVIERSVNGADFEQLNIQSSKGGTQSEVYFDFDDAPATGDNLYRIRLNYQDGTIGYSDPLLVHFVDLIDFTVFPNPASDFIKINLESLRGKEVTIQLINGNGTIIQREEIAEVFGKYFQIDLREMKEGHYAVWVFSPGHKAVAKQFIVGKPK